MQGGGGGGGGAGRCWHKIQVGLVELEAAVLVARVRLSQVQPLDQMELMVSAVAVVAQEEQRGHTTHLAVATAALA
jgi:hypothetical protein